MPCSLILRLLIAAAMTLWSSATSVQTQTFNWAGEWISAPNEVLMAKNVAVNDYGWRAFTDDLEQIQVYSITIEQTDDQFVVKFPRSVANPLNGVRFPGRGERTDLLNFGEVWEKQIITTRDNGSSLELTVTKSNGKWQESKPEETAPAPTDFRLSLKLHRGQTPTEMMLGVLVSDRKGELAYFQFFRRVSETVTFAPTGATASLQLLSLTPPAKTRIARGERITADLTYSVEPFTEGRFFINAVALTTSRDLTMQLTGSEVDLVSASGRVQVSFPVLTAFETPEVSQPLRFRLVLHQRIGELGMSRMIAQTGLIEYRGQ